MSLENFCGRTTSATKACCQDYCGINTSVHNPTYLEFVATDTTVEIDILVLPCSSGTFLQAAVIGNCPWENPDVLTCNPGIGIGGTIELVAHDIIPGESYWLLIDGGVGAKCNFLITEVMGLFHSGSPPVSLQQTGNSIYAATDVGSYTFAWFDCDQNIVLATTQLFEFPQEGCYCVTVRGDSISGTYCITTEATSTKDNGETVHFSIHPNPSASFVDIHVERKLNKPVTVKVFDWNGRCLNQKFLSEGNYRHLFGPQYIAGVYCFVLEDEDGVVAAKSIVYTGTK